MLILYFLLGLNSLAAHITCSNTICDQEFLGDWMCDLACNNPFCFFDSGLDSSYSIYDQFTNSDCYFDCEYTQCDPSLLGDGKCDSHCNNEACAYDLGDCGVCANGCTLEMLSNQVCDSACSVENCSFDMGICGKCAVGCTQANLNSEVCVDACKSSSCLSEIPNPCHVFCAPGCYEFYLGDGYCDIECKNSACEYDNGDCMCAPGCTAEKLQENECFDPDPCNTKECGFKNGKCGYCMSNCFESMIGDGNCDSQCNVFDCHFDFGDCGCSPGCSMIYNVNDDSWSNLDDNVENTKCLTPYCNYNLQNSADPNQVKIAVLNEIIYKNLSIINFSAPSTCSIETIYEFLDQDNPGCDKTDTCYTKKALYCAGRVNSVISGCLRNDGTNCLICSGTMVMGVCTPALSICPFGYNLQADLSALFADSTLTTSMCLRDFTQFSITNPKISYVFSDPDGPSSVGTGTATDPYKSLYFAMTQQYAAFSKIILKQGTHIFQVDESLTIPLIPDIYDPLNSKLFTTMYYLSIEGENPNSKSVVSWRGMLQITQRTQKIYFKHLIFDGSAILMNNCTGSTDFCYYCPYIDSSSESVVDDRGKAVLQEILYNTAFNCSLYSNHVLFSLTTNSFFENIEFNNFRHQFKNLILSSGSLSLQSVKFSKIQVAAGEEAIKILCLKNCETTSILFNNSIVTDFNYGYEHHYEIELGSFFTATKFDSATIRNVTFTYNLALSYIESAYKNWLLGFKDFTGFVTILDCKFDTNYVNSLILLDVQMLRYNSYRQDYQGTSIAYSQTHFTLSNTEFKKIYSSDNFLSYLMKSIVHNILISNVTITDVQCGGSGILSFKNLGRINTKDTIGEIIEATISTMNEIVYIPPRSMNITKLEISNSLSGNFALELLQMPNVNINETKIFNINDGTDYSIDPTIMSFQSASKYLSLVAYYEYLVNLNCSQITNIKSSFNILADSIEIFNTSCVVHQGTSGLYIENVLNDVNLTNIKIYSRDDTESSYYVDSGSSQGYGLHISSCNGKIHLQNIKIFNLFNSDGSVVQIIDSNHIKIFDLYISSVGSVNNSPFSISNFNMLELKSFTITDSISHNGNGGCIELITSGKSDSVLILDSGKLSSCISKLGNGGALIIDTNSRSTFQNLMIKNLYLTKNSAYYGSAFYISAKVQFSDQSIIENVIITNHNSDYGSTIADNHSSGLLTLKNFELNNNSGVISGIQGIYLSEEMVLDIQNMSIANSKAETVFYLSSLATSFIWINNLTIHDNGMLEDSPATCLDITSLIIQAQRLNVYNMGTIILSSASEIEIFDSKFWNIKDTGFSLYFQTFLACIYCELFNFEAMVFIAKEYSSIFLNYTKMHDNIGDVGNALLVSIEDNYEFSTEFYNSLFFNNTNHYGAIFEFITTSVVISNCTIINNSAGVESTILYLDTSSATVENSIFENQKSKYGSFICAISSTFLNTIEIYNSSFLNGSAEIGGAIYVISGELFIINSIFMQNSASETGGAIFTSENEISIYNCTFNNNSALGGADIYSEDVQLFIQDSAFLFSSCINGSSIDISVRFELFIEASEFSFLNKGTSALIVIEAKSVSINSTRFYNISSNDLGAVNFFGKTSQGNVTINDSRFLDNNSTASGAAIYSTDMGLNITNTQISYNYAVENGGGVYFSAPSCKYCTFNIKGYTNITNNTCDWEGGGVSWFDFKPNIDSTVILKNNTAIYGADLASKPANLRIFTPFRSLSTSTIAIYDAVPGQTYTNTILVGLYDTYGSLVVTYSKTELFFALSIEDDEYFFNGNASFKANRGIYAISNFIPLGPPGSSHNFVGLDYALTKNSVANDLTIYDNTIYFEIHLRNCTSGEIIGQNSCLKCPIDRYLIEPDYACKDCPVGGICPGGSDINLKPGYYRSTNESEVIYECPQSEACLGNITGWITPCKEGYYSVKCAACAGGYNKSNQGACFRCPSNTQNGFILFIVFVGIVIICVILVKSSLKSAFTPKAKHSIYIKIFTNYIQLVSIAARFDLKWPSYVTSVIGSQKTTASVSDTIFSLDCYVASKNSGDPVDSYYYKLTMMTLLPVFIFFISALVWLFICFTKETYSYMKRELFLTIIVIFFLVYPYITKMVFSHFSCENIDDLGYYLIENYGIKCWNETHTQYAYIVAIPGLIVWSVGLPTMIMVVMSKRKRFLNRENNKVIFGFIYNGYRISRFFWEFVIVYRKILMICVIVFVSRISIPAQALTITLVLSFTLFLQYEYRPFNSSKLNNLEVESLITATLTIYCGLYYMTENINEEFKLVLFLIIAAGNTYFIFLWVYWMLSAIIEMVAKNHPMFRHIFKKGDSIEAETAQEKVESFGRFFNEDEGKNSYTFINIPKETAETFELKTMKDLYNAVDLNVSIDSSFQAFESGDPVEEVLGEDHDSTKILDLLYEDVK